MVELINNPIIHLAGAAVISNHVMLAKDICLPYQHELLAYVKGTRFEGYPPAFIAERILMDNFEEVYTACDLSDWG